MNSNHLSSDDNNNYFIKILIPAISGGAVIGKGGEALIKAQNDTDTKVKVSKVNEYYPGTNERICLVQGDPEGIIKMVNYITKCISDTRVDPNSYDRHKQTRILIPNTSAGFLIGKEGENINDIKKLSGAYIQVSPKSSNRELVERHVVISGDIDQRRNAMKLIVEKIIQDPKLCYFPYVNYGEMMTTSFGSQYGMGISSPVYPSMVYDGSHQYIAPESANDFKHRKVELNHSSMSGYNGHDQPMSLDTRVLKNILSRNAMPSASFANINLVEIAHALQILAQNGCLCQSNTFETRNQNYYPSQPNSYYTNSQPFTSSFQQLDFMASDSIHGITRTVEVEEAFVGSIIGPKGRSIIELQDITDTNIKVSRKNSDNMDMNNMRTITIKGMYENVSRAYLLINDKIQLEKAKREVSSLEMNLSES